MNILQVLARSFGELRVDYKKVLQRKEELLKQYPHAKITINGGIVKAEVVRIFLPTVGELVYCMKCGKLMINRCNQYVKKGGWTRKKRRDSMSNWECPNCRPFAGGQPLMHVFDDGYIIEKEEE